MLRIAMISLLVSTATARAATVCDEIDWGMQKRKLEVHLQKRAAEGWALVSFAKPGTACFVRTDVKAVTYECRAVKWNDAAELGTAIESLAKSGFEAVAFAKAGTLCGRRSGSPAATVSEKSEAAVPATPAAPDAASGAEPAPKAKAAGPAPQGDVRERANRLHEELKALEAKRDAGQISPEEYDKRKKELEAAAE